MDTIQQIDCREIQVDGNGRLDLGDLTSLAESINNVGLLHPPIITAGRKLVVGKRRLIACRDVLNWNSIPCRTLEYGSLAEARADENTLRKDLNASEKVEFR